MYPMRFLQQLSKILVSFFVVGMLFFSSLPVFEEIVIVDKEVLLARHEMLSPYLGDKYISIDLVEKYISEYDELDRRHIWKIQYSLIDIIQHRSTHIELVK